MNTTVSPLGAVACIVVLAIMAGCGQREVLDANPAGNAPVVFENETIDLGMIAPNDIYTAIFRFKNTSDKSIRPTRTVSGCACLGGTTILDDYALVQPQEVSTLEVKLNTKDMPPDSSIERTVLVEFDGSGDFSTSVTINARIGSQIRIDPRTISFHAPLAVLASGAATQTAVVQVNRELMDGERFSGLEVQVPDYIDAIIQSKDGNRAIIELKLDNRRAPENLTCAVKIVGTDGMVPYAVDKIDVELAQSEMLLDIVPSTHFQRLKIGEVETGKLISSIKLHPTSEARVRLRGVQFEEGSDTNEWIQVGGDIGKELPGKIDFSLLKPLSEEPSTKTIPLVFEVELYDEQAGIWNRSYIEYYLHFVFSHFRH